MRFQIENVSAITDGFELRLVAQERTIENGDHVLDCVIEYDLSTLSAQQAEWLAEEFTTLAGHALAQPDVAVCTLPLMGRDERAQLEEWNRTEREYPGCCVHELFEEQVRRSPKRWRWCMKGRS